MSNLQSALMIVLGELSIILAAILGYLIFRSLRKHKSVMSAIAYLTGKIHNCKDDRQKMLHDFLTQTCHYPDDKAADMAAALLEKERLFYNVLMETYVNNDHESLKHLDQKTEEVIGAYRNLVSESVKAIATEAELDIEARTEQLSKTIDELSEKNKNLNHELDQLKHEMDQTVQEYSSAFRHKPEATTAHDTDSIPIEDDLPEAGIAIETRDSGNEEATTAISDAADDTMATEEDTAQPAMAAPTPPSADQQSDDDDLVEPDFETHGFEQPPEEQATEQAEPPSLDDEIKADLEALTAQFDAEEEVEQEGGHSIPLDGLVDDEGSAEGKKAAQS